MSRITWIALLGFFLLLMLLPLELLQSRGAAQTIPETRKAAIQRLNDSLSPRGQVKTNRATGLVDFIRLNRESTGGLVDSRRAHNGRSHLRSFANKPRALGLLTRLRAKSYKRTK